MSDGDNYFEFHDEESECPTEISEETVLTSATASECATASASVSMATSRPTRTLAKKKLTVQVSFWIFFRFWHRFKWTPYWQREGYCSDWWILNDIKIALRNAHFRYRGSHRVSRYPRSYRYRHSNFRYRTTLLLCSHSPRVFSYSMWCLCLLEFIVRFTITMRFFIIL